MQRLEGCARFPVTVTRAEWVSREINTSIPPAPPHRAWRLEIDLSSDEQLVRMVAILLNRDLGFLNHVRPSNEATTRPEYAVDFFPDVWDRDDDVQLNVFGLRSNVTSRQLTREPHLATRLLLQGGHTITSGTVTDVAEFADTGWVAQVALIAQSDTKKSRTRWRIRSPQATSAGEYDFLWSGRRSGFVDLKKRDHFDLST